MHYIYSNPLKCIIYEDCYTILYNTGMDMNLNINVQRY